MTETTSVDQPPRVFLISSHEDASAAALVVRSLRLDFAVEMSNPELSPGQTIASTIQDAVESSDIVIVLLSQAALRTNLFRVETAMALSLESRRREIDLVPVLLEPCEIPEGLSDRLAVDLSQDGALGVGRLITRLMGDRAVDFKSLDPSSFEHLVLDVLTREHFVLSDAARGPEMGYDFVGSHGDERWVVEVKHYRPQDRLSVSVINQLIAALRSNELESNALLVTSGQLTSVAQSYLDEASRQFASRIEIIDGVALKQLLAKYPDLIAQYFTRGRSHVRPT